jgi:Protein of unknown function (DUF1688)
VSLALREGPAAALKSAVTIRERCRNIAAAVTAGQSHHFRIDRTRLDDTAAMVAAVTRRRYPDLGVPCHSRWRHFETGGIDRKAELDRALAGRSAADRARAHIDLSVASVLLDAGAGAAWSFVEAESGQRYTRSEGLAVASFRAFMRGAFSARQDDPLRVDASALAAMDAATLASLFQAGTANPLLGLDGRAALLRRLGSALATRRHAFGDTARPGALFDMLTRLRTRRAISASTLLHALLDGLGPIWRSGSALDGVPLGDVWRHPHAGGSGPTAGWVPFHKLSQWLAYSLFEPFEWAGIMVTDREQLTALPEYRNGGLLLDAGVLQLIEAAYGARTWNVGDELVVEWRALTVALIDELAPRIRAHLGAPALPLACILEGGTWAAGRELAAGLRGGNPPLSIDSDGTVF